MLETVWRKWAWRKWLLVIFVTTFYGCASAPYVPTMDERLDSASYGIYQNIKLQALVNECKIFQGPTLENALASQESWWERNWPYVYAADQEFLADTQKRQAELGADEGLLFALKFVMESEERAAQEAKKVPRASPNEEAMCEHLLGEFKDGKMDFPSSTKHFPVIKYLAEKYPLKNELPYPVPNLKTNYQARATVGKSYYKAENYAAKTWCPRVKILTIKDVWPDELFGAYCDNGAMHLIVCSWGNCNTQSH